jgi:hypothetical protein
MLEQDGRESEGVEVRPEEKISGSGVEEALGGPGDLPARLKVFPRARLGYLPDGADHGTAVNSIAKNRGAKDVRARRWRTGDRPAGRLDGARRLQSRQDLPYWQPPPGPTHSTTARGRPFSFSVPPPGIISRASEIPA